ncbi:MAG TPA: S8 family serine peptidase [Pseudaminobacter sp.]|nr:S8 family serine peptidase [Pseudaminobacter sp.]
MDRKDFAVIFYGVGRTPVPWATDCPVRFDAWLAFANLPAARPPLRVDVILAVNEEHGVQRILDQFYNLSMSASVNPIAAGSFVAAELTLDELIRAVLPLTNLHSLLFQAQKMPEVELRALATDEDRAVVALDPVDGNERAQERQRHLAWLVRVLATVADRSPRPTNRTRSAAIKAVVKMMQNAMVRPEMTQVPSLPGDQVIDRRRRYPVVTVTTNRISGPAVSRSRLTVKADAAEAVFSVDCRNIGWAVVDSGIDADHPAFADWNTSTSPPTIWPGPGRVLRAFDLVGARATLSADTTDNGLIDWTRALPYLEMAMPLGSMNLGDKPYRTPVYPHGTHVAGVLGGHWPERGLRGICPTIRLYDFRVLDDNGEGDEFAIVMSLQAIRHINEQAGRLAIAGVNVSLSVPHDVAAHSCGWTPVCVECDRLVRTGVVVVTSAGNSGFTGAVRTGGADYHTVSIADPGNADSVLTVGSTHRSDPHRHGVSYFSSRGPTADGRLKPDLLAPGEDIDGPVPGDRIAAMHGTSQAAAHVSGAAAMLISRHRELIGRPDRVKQILCSTATDLGRERWFQGHGLIDVLRAMQAV